MQQRCLRAEVVVEEDGEVAVVAEVVLLVGMIAVEAAEETALVVDLVVDFGGMVKVIETRQSILAYIAVSCYSVQVQQMDSRS